MASMFKWVLWLSILVVIIAFSGIIGHVFQIPFLLSWGHESEPMSVPSSVAAFLLSICVLLLSSILTQMSEIMLRLHNIYSDKEIPDEIKRLLKGKIDNK